MKIREFRRTNAPIGGFTLVELMVTVAILVILLAIGVPAMQGFLAQRQVAAKGDALASAMRYARSEALKRALPVSMCRTSNPDSTTPACAAQGGANDWNTGWLIFVDSNGDGNLDANELLLKVQQALSGPGAIAALPSNMQSLTFTGDGLAAGFMSSFMAIPTSGDCSKVVLASTGRVSAKKVVRGLETCQ